MENIVNQIIIPFARNLILAVVVWFVGSSLIRKLGQIIRRRLEKSKIDETLKPFIISLVSNSLKVLLVISIVGIFGVETTSFAAIPRCWKTQLPLSG